VPVAIRLTKFESLRLSQASAEPIRRRIELAYFAPAFASPDATLAASVPGFASRMNV